MNPDEPDLHALLLDDLTTEPPAQPAAVTLRAARRRLTRRRWGVGVGVGALLVAAGTGAAAYASWRPTGVEVASSPFGAASEVTTCTDDPRGDAALLDARSAGWAVNAGNGELHTNPQVVTQSRALPAGTAGADRAYALQVEHGPRVEWVLATWTARGVDGCNATQTRRPYQGVDFDQWVREEQSYDAVSTADFDPFVNDPHVQVDNHGRVTVAPGVEVLQRIDNPLHLTAPYTSSALRLRYDGREVWWFVDPALRQRALAGHAPQRSFTEFVSAASADAFNSGYSGPMDGDHPQLPCCDLTAGEHPMPVVNPDLKVVRRVENPLHLTAPGNSVGYEFETAEGRKYFYVYTIDRSGLLAFQTSAHAGDRSFDEWLAHRSAGTQW